MSTFILNPNDTIVMSDSIVAKAAKTADACQAYVNEAATNWADVEIVKYVCITVLSVSLIVAITVYLCYIKQVNAAQKQKEFDNSQKQIENLQRLQMEKNKLEESKKGNDCTAGKTRADHTVEILKTIAALSKNKDDRADKDTAIAMFDLYKNIKKELQSGCDEK